MKPQDIQVCSGNNLPSQMPNINCLSWFLSETYILRPIHLKFYTEPVQIEYIRNLRFSRPEYLYIQLLNLIAAVNHPQKNHCNQYYPFLRTPHSNIGSAIQDKQREQICNLRFLYPESSFHHFPPGNDEAHPAIIL